MSPTLLVISGLPGSGKSTLARQLAAHLRAPYLRVDTVEAALLNAAGRPVTVEGYAALYGVAADNLRLGLSVIADCVNPLAVTREAWAWVAETAGAALVNVEVICSDPLEHRRRVEARAADPASWVGDWAPPGWERVASHHYEAWTTPRLVLDTAGRDADANFAQLLALLGRANSPPLESPGSQSA